MALRSVSSSSMPRVAKLYKTQQEKARLDDLMEKKQITEEQEEERKRLEKKRWQLSIWLILAILLAVALVTAVLRSLIETGGVLWLFQSAKPAAQVGEIATVLAPLFAVAVAVERLLESGFEWYEQTMGTLTDVLGKSREALSWIEQEVLRAYEAAQEAAAKIGIESKPSELEALDKAEVRLTKAEERLHSWVTGPEYKSWKRSWCILIGLGVGLEVAVWGNLGMFHLIGFQVPRLLDMVVTGFVIGVGPGPMHSLFGILQGIKDALSGLATAAEGRSVREALEELRSAVRGAGK